MSLGPPWCVRCGAPEEVDVPRCAACPPELARARAPFLFQGPVRTAVHRMKFARWRGVADALGLAMASVWDGEADAVTWVPLSKRRLAERGFDQARALAEVSGRALGLPVVSLLARTGDTAPQARREVRSRRLAMAGLFVTAGRPPPRVLLVDDVLTTGATAAACARALRESGSLAVSLLSAARAISAPVLEAILARGPRPGLWLPRGEDPRQSMPAAGETTHVRRPLVAEHGAV